MKFFRFLLLIALVPTIVISCDKDDDMCEATYDTNVKPIIEAACSYSGCHSGGDASMWVPDGSKDYTTYAGMLDNLNNGLFKERTLDSLNMPDPMFVPDNYPETLTQEELDILACWIDNGFPEN